MIDGIQILQTPSAVKPVPVAVLAIVAAGFLQAKELTACST
jgi:hypothetical protein